MKFSILVSQRVKTLKEFKDTLDKVSINEYVTEDQINILNNLNGTDDFLSVGYGEGIKELYDEEEWEILIEKINEPLYFFVVQFREFRTFFEFVKKLYDLTDFLVDNEFGYHYKKEEFLKIKSFDEFISSH